jgi:hypothetical protein
MRTLANELTVWEALAMLCRGRDGTPMTEERARWTLRSIGMKEDEINSPYPEESLEELFVLMVDEDKLKSAAEEASEWMIARN